MYAITLLAAVALLIYIMGPAASAVRTALSPVKRWKQDSRFYGYLTWLFQNVIKKSSFLIFAVSRDLVAWAVTRVRQLLRSRSHSPATVSSPGSGIHSITTIGRRVVNQYGQAIDSFARQIGLAVRSPMRSRGRQHPRLISPFQPRQPLSPAVQNPRQRPVAGSAKLATDEARIQPIVPAPIDDGQHELSLASWKNDGGREFLLPGKRSPQPPLRPPSPAHFTDIKSVDSSLREVTPRKGVISERGARGTHVRSSSPHGRMGGSPSKSLHLESGLKSRKNRIAKSHDSPHPAVPTRVARTASPSQTISPARRPRRDDSDGGDKGATVPPTHVQNPETKKMIKVGGPTYSKLVSKGYTLDPQGVLRKS